MKTVLPTYRCTEHVDEALPPDETAEIARASGFVKEGRFVRENPMIDLMKFCSKDESRFNIHQPFSKGNWTYATNGHIAIRVPRADVPEKAGTPDCEKIFADALARGEPPWMDLPPFKLERKICSTCKGTGFIDDNGESCSEHSKDGYGCEDCEGGEILSGRATIQAEKDQVTLNAKYLDLLKDLPGIKIGIFGDESTRTDKPCRLKFDGGDGLLMGIRL